MGMSLLTESVVWMVPLANAGGMPVVLVVKARIVFFSRGSLTHGKRKKLLTGEEASNLGEKGTSCYRL